MDQLQDTSQNQHYKTAELEGIIVGRLITSDHGKTQLSLPDIISFRER